MSIEHKIIKILNEGKIVDLNQINNSKFYKIVDENDCFIYFLMPLKGINEFFDDLNENIIARKYNLMIDINYINNSIYNIKFFSNDSGYISFDYFSKLKIFEITPKDLFALRILAEEKKIHNKYIFKFFNRFNQSITNNG